MINCHLIDFFIKTFYRKNSTDLNVLKKLSKTHLKIIDATNLINEILSPLLMYSFFLTFCVLCVFIFTTLIFTVQFFHRFLWFAILNTFLNVHLFLTMLKLLLLCYSTAKIEREIFELLCQVSFESNDQSLSDKVSQPWVVS